MIKGNVVLEDMEIAFHEVPLNQGEALNAPPMMMWTVTDHFDCKVETKTGPAKDFMNALSIAVHHDGMPDAVKDYPASEALMGSIRWIP